LQVEDVLPRPGGLLLGLVVLYQLLATCLTALFVESREILVKMRDVVYIFLIQFALGH
jgi:hypothetical protein